MTPSARSFIPVLPVLLALLALPALTTAIDASHGRDRDRTVRVNCHRGQSLQRAIDRVPGRIDPLVIEVRGFCEGPLQVRRPLLIRGLSPDTDGITAPADGDVQGQSALVEVSDVPGLGAFSVNGVQFESIGIQLSPAIGLLVTDSSVGLTDVEIRGGAQDALFAGGSAVVVANNTGIHDNAGQGLVVRGARVVCNGCDISNNGATGDRWGVSAVAGASVVLNDSTVTGRFGVRATLSEVIQGGGHVNALMRAHLANRGGHISFQNDAQVTGDIWCNAQSSLTTNGQGAGTFGLNQLATTPGSFNFMGLGCAVLSGAPGTTNFAGMTRFGPDAHVAANNGATVAFEQLDCYAGGTATWVTPGVITVNGVAGVEPGCQP
ncbi:MAG: hypothetical protein AB7P34_03930 [Vicinamibacterales bacterium]